MVKINIKNMRSPKLKVASISLDSILKNQKNDTAFDVTPYRKGSIRILDKVDNANEHLKFLQEIYKGVLFINIGGHDNKNKVIIMRKDLELYYYSGRLDSYLNHKMTVKVKEIIECNGVNYILLTRRPLLKAEFNELAQRTEPFEAKIVTLVKYGAYLQYKNIKVLLPNKNFAAIKGIKVQDLYKVGDKLTVKIAEIDVEHNLIKVETLNKYKTTVDISTILNSLKEGQMLHGEIRTWNPVEVYVQIYPGLDCLCNVPSFEFSEGMNVNFEIKHIRGHKIRGKIKSIHREDTDYNIFINQDEDNTKQEDL